MKPETLEICAPDLAKTLQDWTRYLQHEKQVSRHTLRAYSTDITQFVTFLAYHKGNAPSLNDLSEVSLGDFRAWMARKAMDGAGAVSGGGQHGQDSSRPVVAPAPVWFHVRCVASCSPP